MLTTVSNAGNLSMDDAEKFVFCDEVFMWQIIRAFAAIDARQKPMVPDRNLPKTCAS